MNRRMLLQIAAAAALAMPGAASAQDTVKIGLILPMTGQQASTGKQIDAAVKLYQACNGTTVAGKKVEVILKDDTGQSIVPTLASVYEEWATLKGRPARNQLLVGLARYAADVRRNKNSQGFAQTALRFAAGRTTVDVFEK